MAADGDRQKRIERMQRLRTKIVEWSSKHCHEQLESGIRCWLGARKPTKEKVQEAMLFALMAPSGDGPSLIERYQSNAKQSGRFERQIFESWAGASFSIFEISNVKEEEGFDVLDVITGESLWVCEKTASKSVSAGDWLAAFLKRIDGQIELEGLIVSLVPGTRRPAMEALLGEYRSRDLPVASPRPEGTRQCAMGVMAAIREAEQAVSQSGTQQLGHSAGELRQILGLA